MYAEEWRVLQGDANDSTWTTQFDSETWSGVYDSIETALHEAERDVVWLRLALAARRGEQSPADEIDFS